MLIFFHQVEDFKVWRIPDIQLAFQHYFHVCSWAKYKSRPGYVISGHRASYWSYCHIVWAVLTGTLLNAPFLPHYSSRRSLAPWPLVCLLFIYSLGRWGFRKGTKPMTAVRLGFCLGSFFFKAALIRYVLYLNNIELTSEELEFVGKLTYRNHGRPWSTDTWHDILHCLSHRETDVWWCCLFHFKPTWNKWVISLICLEWK